MTNKKDLFLIYVLIFFEVLILSNSKIVINSVIQSSTMFIIKIFPSLFPTMVIGNLLVKNNVQLIIPKSIKHLFYKSFGFSDIMAGIFVTSMLTGCPSNAMYINEYLSKNLINEKQAETLLCTTHFINPLFVIGGVGIGVFNNAKIGILLLIILWISNFFKAFLCRIKTQGNFKNNNVTIYKTNFISSITIIIKNSINSLLMIFGIVIMFNVLIILIKNIFNFNDIISTFVNGFLEMTSGVISLANLNINLILKILISYLFLNFGGLCIQMQTLSMLENKKIRYLKYLIFRLF